MSVCMCTCVRTLVSVCFYFYVMYVCRYLYIGECVFVHVWTPVCVCVFVNASKCKRMSKGHRRKTKDHRWEKPDTCGRHCDGEIKAVITRQVTRRWTENSSQCSSIKLHFARVFISCSKRYPTCLHSECTAVLLTMEETLWQRITELYSANLQLARSSSRQMLTAVVTLAYSSRHR